MIDELRARFRIRFIETARGRIRRALELIGGGDESSSELAIELHSLAGEAALLGLKEISDVARSGELDARQWSQGDVTAKLRCVRAVRTLGRKIDEFAEESPAPEARDSAASASKADAYRVLVVDDSTLSGEHITDALGDSGIETRLATDRFTAIEEARHFKPHAVLSDVHMPGIELDQLCGELRQAAQDPVLVILLSGMSEDNLAMRAREVGADDYITKQRGTEHVLERLQLILRECER